MAQYDYITDKVGAPSDPDDLTTLQSNPLFYTKELPIAPGASLTSEISDQVFRKSRTNPEISPNEKFFYGSIHYDDIFGENHVSKFCFRVDGLIIMNTAEIYQKLCSHWNCADKDNCSRDKQTYDNDAAKILETMPKDGLPTSPANHGRYP